MKKYTDKEISEGSVKLPFYIYLKDNEKKTFCVAGPMMDDTKWNRACLELQKNY